MRRVGATGADSRNHMRRLAGGSGGGLDVEDDLRSHARELLAGYKVPKRVEFREELARTATGKLQKFKLRAEYWEGRDRLVN